MLISYPPLFLLRTLSLTLNRINQKTQLAKAVAGEAHASFLSIGPSDILSKFVGESEASIRSVFMEAVRLARNNTESKCTVLFFDEIDALGQSRGGSGGSGTTSGKAPLAAVGSEQSGGGGGGGDTSSRRVLAELLIQLTKVNASHGNYDLLVPEKNDKDQEGSSNGDDDTSMTTIMDMVEGDNNQKYRRHNAEEEDGNSIDSDERTVCGEELMVTDEEQEHNVERQRRQSGSRATGDDDNDNSVRVIVVAATNRPEDCDPALIRRFAVQVNVGLPTKKDRKKILKQNMKEIDHAITKKQFSDLAAITDGWSGSDLESLAREAAMAPVRECIRSAAMMKRRRLLSAPREGRKLQQQYQQPKNKKISDGIGAAHLQGENKEDQINTNSTHQTSEMVDNDDDDDDAFVRARERLLEEFRNLRLVDIRDYKRALHFLFIRMYPNIHDSPLAEFGWIDEDHNAVGNGGLNEHYDSSSDEEEEEGDEQHEENLLI